MCCGCRTKEEVMMLMLMAVVVVVVVVVGDVAREVCHGTGYGLLLWTAAHGVYSSGAKSSREGVCVLVVCVD